MAAVSDNRVSVCVCARGRGRRQLTDGYITDAAPPLWTIFCEIVLYPTFLWTAAAFITTYRGLRTNDADFAR